MPQAWSNLSKGEKITAVILFSVLLLIMMSSCDSGSGNVSNSTKNNSASYNSAQINYEKAVNLVNKNVTDSTADKFYYAMSDYEALQVRACENEFAKTVRIDNNADVHKLCVVAIAGR